MMSRILVIGEVHGIADRAALQGVDAPAVPQAKVAKGAIRAGGLAFALAAGLADLGFSVRLVSSRGGDAAGRALGRAVTLVGIEDAPLTFLDRATRLHPQDHVEDDGLGVASPFPPAIGARQLRRRTLRDAIGAAALVVADAALGEAAIACLAEACSASGTALWCAAGEASALTLRLATPGAARSEEEVEAAERPLRAPAAARADIPAGGVSRWSLRIEGRMAVVEAADHPLLRFELDALGRDSSSSNSAIVAQQRPLEERHAAAFAAGCLGAAALGWEGLLQAGGACALALARQTKRPARSQRDLSAFAAALWLAGSPEPLP